MRGFQGVISEVFDIDCTAFFLPGGLLYSRSHVCTSALLSVGEDTLEAMPKTTTFDGTEVEYVEVHDEPIHRRQFSNEYVYVYIAGIRPGETSLWHRHSENTLYVCVEHGAAALNRPTDKVRD